MPVPCCIQVAKEIEAAVQAAVSKQAKKQQAVAAQAAAATDSRQRTELEAAVKSEEHKARQLQQVQEKFAALLAGEAWPGAGVCGPAVCRAYNKSVQVVKQRASAAGAGCVCSTADW
jgi:hypothetical protein